VLRRKAGGEADYTLTIRYRAEMSAEDAAKALRALRELEAKLLERVDGAE